MSESPSQSAGTAAERFAAVAAELPERPALYYEGLELDYRSLESAARAFSNFLKTEDDPGTQPLAIDLERPDQTVIACVAALLVGRPFTCLLKGLRPARRRERLRQSGARQLLSEDPQGSIHPKRRDARGRRLPSLGLQALDPSQTGPREGEASPLPFADVARTPPPDRAAFIVQTSGSTGTPLTLIRSHRNLLQNVDRLAKERGISAEDRVSMLIPPGFGASFNDVFLALLTGACLCPLDVAQLGHRALRRLIEEGSLSYLHCVPTLFRSFCATLEPEAVFGTVRTLRIGGEPLHRSDVALFRRHFARGSVLLHGYSMAESAGSVAEYPIDHDTAIESAVVPVGKPVGDREIELLDELGQAVPDGESGEIVIRSDFLAQAYLGNREASERRFRPDPAPRPGQSAKLRLHTGDLGRWDEQGRLCHLGRRDRRVKQHGRRLNLGKIEAIYSEHPAVDKTIVIQRDPVESHDLPRVAAYVSLAQDRRTNGNILYNWGRSQLAVDEIPQEFYVVDRFPLLENGKINRKAFGDPQALADLGVRARRSLVHCGAAPRSEIETRIVEIFRRHLQQDVISTYDCFFDLGGTSLLAMQMAAEISQTFSVELPPHLIAGRPSPAALAELVVFQDPANRKSAPRGGVPISHEDAPLATIRRDGDGDVLVILPGGTGGEVELTGFARIVPCLDESYPVYGFRATCLGKVEPFPASVQEIASRYLEAIQGEVGERPLILLGNCHAGRVAYEMACQLRQRDHSHRLILNDSRTVDHVDRYGSYGNFKGVDEKTDRTFAPAVQRYLELLRNHQATRYEPSIDLVLSEEYASTGDHTLGWQNTTEGEIRIHRVLGSHLESISGVAGFGRVLRRVLDSEQVPT